MSANFSGILKPPFVIPEIQGWQAYTVLGLIGCMLISLVAELAPPYLVMMGTLVVLLALSILDVESALHGFADEAMLSVAVLFVVAKGIEQSGGLEYVASVLFRTPDKTKEMLSSLRPSKTKGSIVWVLLKFSVPVAIFSAVLANIPLVAMMIPPIVQFGNKVNMHPSKMLMPLSYAAQLGGTMTLIGASTNLMVLSMAAQKLPQMKMNLFEIGIIGVPVTIAGIFYIIVFSGKLLPDRLAQQPTTINPREYNVALVMKPTSSLARKSIEKSGINRQPGLTLLSIDRDGTEITSPTPDFVLQPKDRLHFVGVVDSVLLLVQLNGLVLSEDEGQDQVDLNRLKTTQCLVEAVVASESPMVHKRIADLQFQERYKAAVVAIHRYGTRLNRAIGEVEVEAGDCLLLVVDGSEFVNKHRNNSTFALVAQLPGFKPVNRRKAAIAAVLILALIVASGVGVKLITAALFSAAGLLITKCLSPRDAMVIAEYAFSVDNTYTAINQGMVESGAATMLAKALMSLAGKSLFGLVTCTYVATTIFSLAITNNAAVTIMFPVALAAADQQKLDFRPFAYILMMAASAGFMTPTGCPTNLMVYTPGGYKFSDYIYYGGPMQKSTHPKPHAPDPASSPPAMTYTTSGADPENPKALLIQGNPDSASFALNPPIHITGDHAGSNPSSSDPKPSPLSASTSGTTEALESLSKRTMNSSSTFSNLEMSQPLPTSPNPSVSVTAGSSSPSNVLLVSPSLPFSSCSTLLQNLTTESTSQQLTLPATDPSSSAIVSISPAAKLPSVRTEDIPSPSPLTSISAAPPSIDPNLISMTNYNLRPAVSSVRSKPESEPTLRTPVSLQTQKIPSFGPLHTPPKDTGLSYYTTPGLNLTTIPPSLPSSTDSIIKMEPSSSRVSSSTPSTSAPGQQSKLNILSAQHPPVPVTVSKPTGPQGKGIVKSDTLVTTQSSTQSRGPSISKPAEKTSVSSSPGSTATPSSLQTPSTPALQEEPLASKTQGSKPTSAIHGYGPMAAGSTNFFPQYVPPPTAAAFPLLSVSEQTAAAKNANLLSKSSPDIKVTSSTPTGPVRGKSAAPTSFRSPGTQISTPLAPTIPVLPGPEVVAAAAAKRASLTHPDPSPPVPAAVPIPPIPGPGTAAAKRAKLQQQR
ncbi:hypothetical protein R1flu_002164 [Riccia fluitans]|uniref:RCK C-terminal domain-containing protein n=1 Tax=Riccia fluitans TaxID=41844 RepID=A0ABD1Y5C6_9MARC